jgi:hypothetical protein
LLRLIDKLGRIVPGCNIKPDYDPTKPNTMVIEQFGYNKAMILRTTTFCRKVKHMKHNTFRKTTTFYSNLVKNNKKKIIILSDDKEDIDILDEEEQEEEMMVEEQEEVIMEESTSEC